MKLSRLFFTFGATLILTSSALAAGGEHGKGHGDEGHGGGAHRDNTSLFPQPTTDPSKAEAPEPVKLSSPAFQSTVNTDKVTLKWNTTAGADVYHVQVAKDPNFKWLLKEDHAVKGTEFNVDGLEKGKHYFWRVAAWKNGNKAATNKSFFATSMFETK